ncbi:MAG: ABC transporter permease subunit [Candidatus Brockarchaeota archaeon]|nr:ABC transporter permease subunit [Candidatus Brockarchaeota archaeon]MBO3808992.1 ABC transporter permease subunit [Candidatus Brockarchaeota archaeon]
MRLSRVMLVFEKDWLGIKRNREVLLPMIILPLILSIGFSGILIIGTAVAPEFTSSMEDLENMVRSLLEHERSELMQMTVPQAAIYFFTLYILAQFFLIIPVMTSSVIAADSFAGEKERKTIEALLATPIFRLRAVFRKGNGFLHSLFYDYNNVFHSILYFSKCSLLYDV